METLNAISTKNSSIDSEIQPTMAERANEIKEYHSRCTRVIDELPELEEKINQLIFDFEDKHRETGLLIVPAHYSDKIYNKEKGGRIQLSGCFSMYEPDRSYVSRTKDGKRR